MKRVVLVVLYFLFSSIALGADRPETSRYMKAYTGGEGVTVWLLRVGPHANREALVQIVGIDNQWDGRIQKMVAEVAPRGVKYVLSSNGKRYEVLTMEDGAVELSVPGLPGRAMLHYDRGMSERGNPEHFLTEYLTQN